MYQLGLFLGMAHKRAENFIRGCKDKNVIVKHSLGCVPYTDSLVDSLQSSLIRQELERCSGHQRRQKPRSRHVDKVKPYFRKEW